MKDLLTPHQLAVAGRVLDEMRAWGLEPDTYSLNLVLAAHYAARRPADADRILARLCASLLPLLIVLILFLSPALTLLALV